MRQTKKETIISSSISDRMTTASRVSKIIEELKKLANSSFNSKEDLLRASTAATDLLFASYQAGVSNPTYSCEDQQVIGSLVPAALQGLSYKISQLQTSFSSTSIDTVRIQRSGLQFFIDTFKDFPVNTPGTSQTLKEALQEFVEREDIEGLDERLRTAEFDPYCDDSERSASFEAEIAKLPSSHWWFHE